MPKAPSNRSKHPLQRRSYRSATRDEAAAQTRVSIIRAAKEAFEQHGWAASRVALIAAAAGVSQKTVEAIFGTKSALLKAAVDFAIRGDDTGTPMMQRPHIKAIEDAPDAASMLALHASHLRHIHARSARLTRAVEQAAAVDANVAELWEVMTHNREDGVKWASEVLLAKEDAPRMSRREVEAVFWVAVEGDTYRHLTDEAGFSDDEYEAWTVRYYLRWFCP